MKNLLKKIFLLSILWVSLFNISYWLTPSNEYLKFKEVLWMNWEWWIVQNKLNNWYNSHWFSYDLIQTNVYPKIIELSKSNFLNEFDTLNLNWQNVQFISHLKWDLYISWRNVFKWVWWVNVFLDDIDNQVFWRNINCLPSDWWKVSDTNLPAANCSQWIDLSFIEQWNWNWVLDDNNAKIKALAIMTEKQSNWDSIIPNNYIYWFILIPSWHIILPEKAFPSDKTYVSKWKWYLPNFTYENEWDYSWKYSTRLNHTCKIAPTSLKVVKAYNWWKISDISFWANDNMKVILDQKSTWGIFEFQTIGSNCDNKDDNVIINFDKKPISVVENKWNVRFEEFIEWEDKGSYVHIEWNTWGKKTVLTSSCKINPKKYSLEISSYIQKQVWSKKVSYNYYYNNINDVNLPVKIYKNASVTNPNILFVAWEQKKDTIWNTLKKNANWEYWYWNTSKDNYFSSTWTISWEFWKSGSGFAIVLEDWEIDHLWLWKKPPHFIIESNNHYSKDWFSYENDYEYSWFFFTSLNWWSLKVEWLDWDCSNNIAYVNTIKPHIEFEVIPQITSWYYNWASLNNRHSSLFWTDIRKSNYAINYNQIYWSIYSYFTKPEYQKTYWLYISYNVPSNYDNWNYWNDITWNELTFKISWKQVINDSMNVDDLNNNMFISNGSNTVDLSNFITFEWFTLNNWSYSNENFSIYKSWNDYILTIHKPSLSNWNIFFKLNKLVTIVVEKI